MSNKFREILNEIDLKKTFENYVFDDDDVKKLSQKIVKLVSQAKTNNVSDFCLFSAFTALSMEEVEECLPKHHKLYKENLDMQNGLTVLYHVYMLHKAVYDIYNKYIKISENSFKNLDPVFKEVYFDFMEEEASLLEKRSVYLRKIMMNKEYKRDDG